MKHSEKTSDAYANSLNKALSYIDANIHDQLTLEDIAREANYSSFHFHRLFKSLTKETVYDYINRKRVENAAIRLIHRPNESITDVYLNTGFNSNTSFTRAFKKFYSLSPSNFRAQNPGKFSKINQEARQPGKDHQIFEPYVCEKNPLLIWINEKAKLKIKCLTVQNIAYVTQIGLHRIDESFKKLINWSKIKGLSDPPELKLGMMYHDSFKITSSDKVRMSPFIQLKRKIKGEGAIGTTSIEAGKYLVGHFEIRPEEFEKAWKSMFVWMSENGYKKTSGNAFEVYLNNFTTHPENLAIVDLYIPIQ